MSDKKPKPRVFDAEIGESAGTAEGLQVVLDGPGGSSVETQRGTPHFPCPKCGSVSKPHHGVGERICFNKECRATFQAEDVEAQYLPADGPVSPCPKCGKETKEHHTPPGSRICSDKSCRGF